MSDFADLDHLIAMQSDLVESLRSVEGVNGVGIGRRHAGGTLAFRVKVTNTDAVADIPTRFRGVDVIVDVIGTVRAMKVAV